jgi:hypothetical protein
VEQDELTVLKPGRSVPGARDVHGAHGVAAEPNALYVSTEPQALGDTPTWPGADERPQWTQQRWQMLGPQQRQRAPAGYVSALAFGISLGANVVLLAGLLGVLGVLLLNNAGTLSLRGASGQQAPGGSTHGAALSSPTATSTPVSSPTPSVGWLQVTPGSVQLDCGDSQQVEVVLENTGPQTVDWQVVFSLPADRAGVRVDPQQGELAAGDTVLVQLQNSTQSSGQQGAIDFAPASPDAGPPASLSYTTAGC